LVYSEGKESILHTSIVLHFIREGRFELASKFAQEAHVDIPESFKTQFIAMYQILEALKAGSLDLAISWARERRYVNRHSRIMEGGI
jgi:E3 ubiquitin-protein transferase RMND5